MSAWGEWAAEAEGSPERWAFLYKLSYHRAESFLKLLGEQAERIEEQARVTQMAFAELALARREIADLSEQVEGLTEELEQVEARSWAS